ncbi:F0F1 ATP synthase subunit delta [Reinekea blandensis]|uniref:ATP synthase subunit delta n=1 Tax=Reinekea blandensis MED297 TaxID=314283 RepID=A4B9C3_9GAMM|nr:F0F1 ATP synthase subunit delta [Reinekea blandensis]EAR11224.1 H+-transporting two-sector ATPase, delta (OSCP) subunit [Reinekea sp. MED297] [Reinekea blandensis MED297]
MAELSTLARPYAKAAFSAAVDSGDIATWSTALQTLAVISKAESVAELIASPSVSALDKAKTIADIAGDDCNEGASNLLVVLAENDRFALLSEISSQFELLRSEHEKSADVVVTSAFELSDAQQKALTEKLTAKLSREVSMTVKVDSALIGGVIIKAGDLVIDGSVRGKLSKLADAMNS